MDLLQLLCDSTIYIPLIIVAVASILILIFKLLEYRFKINTSLIVQALEAIRNENYEDYETRLNELLKRVKKIETKPILNKIEEVKGEDDKNISI